MVCLLLSMQQEATAISETENPHYAICVVGIFLFNESKQECSTAQKWMGVTARPFLQLFCLFNYRLDSPRPQGGSLFYAQKSQGKSEIMQYAMPNARFREKYRIFIRKKVHIFSNYLLQFKFHALIIKTSRWGVVEHNVSKSHKLMKGGEDDDRHLSAHD